MMAEMDGIGLLERLKDSFPDLPVIMVTAVHDISVALAAIRNGAYDYLLKPFEREQMLAMVRRALEHRRLRLENRAYQSNLESLVAARTEQLRQTMTDLERSYDITLEALGDALDLKDAETEGHSKRVTAFTIAVARAMGLTGERIRVIARGAFLHDIGKMAIPDAILRKPGALDPDEKLIMQEHCYRGYHMLRKIPFLSEAADIVYSHQEKYDGSGYPRGLKGEQIPWAPAYSRWLIPWTRLLLTVRTARRSLPKPHWLRSLSTPERSLIRPSSARSSRCLRLSGKTCGGRSTRRSTGITILRSS